KPERRSDRVREPHRRPPDRPRRHGGRTALRIALYRPEPTRPRGALRFRLGRSAGRRPEAGAGVRGSSVDTLGHAGDAGRGAPSGAEPSPVTAHLGEHQMGLSGGRTRYRRVREGIALGVYCVTGRSFGDHTPSALPMIQVAVRSVITLTVVRDMS